MSKISDNPIYRMVMQPGKGGGIVPTGTIEITSNDTTYNVTNYAKAKVKVPHLIGPGDIKRPGYTANPTDEEIDAANCKRYILNGRDETWTRTDGSGHFVYYTKLDGAAKGTVITSRWACCETVYDSLTKAADAACHNDELVYIAAVNNGETGVPDVYLVCAYKSDWFISDLVGGVTVIANKYVDGAIVPTGTIGFKKNGTYDVAKYAKAVVAVAPYGEGQCLINKNSVYNVGKFATANVQVPSIPAGDIKTPGHTANPATKEIDALHCVRFVLNGTSEHWYSAPDDSHVFYCCPEGVSIAKGTVITSKWDCDETVYGPIQDAIDGLIANKKEKIAISARDDADHMQNGVPVVWFIVYAKDYTSVSDFSASLQAAPVTVIANTYVSA